MVRFRAIDAFPPDSSIIRHGDVGEYRIALHGGHSVGVAFRIRPGRHAKIARFWIDRPEPTVWSHVDPGNVFTDGSNAPALVFKRRPKHCEIRLAAGAGERPCDVHDIAIWRLQLEDEHVLGKPALISPHRGRNAKGEAFLTKKRISTVSGAHA